MFEPIEATNEPVIKVIGIGGGGGNAVEHMVRECIEGVEFFIANTDAQALRKSQVEQTIQIGSNLTKGLGAGANPEVGRTAAQEDHELIRAALNGADMVFIAVGMGGGTGTGGAPVVAEIAKELGILTVAVVTKPFHFEGKKRMAFAEQGILELAKYVDSLITIPNDKMLKVLGRNISFLDAFAAANDVLKGAVQGIAELITRPGSINVDFADVRTVMSEMGYAMMGSGRATGDNRAEVAAEMAISSPLLEDINLSGARGVLVNVCAGMDLRLEEFEIVGNTVREFASDNATVVIGASLDYDMSDEIRVTVVATGIGIGNRSEADLAPSKNQNGPIGIFNKIKEDKVKVATNTTHTPVSSEISQIDRVDLSSFVSNAVPAETSVAAQQSKIATETDQPDSDVTGTDKASFDIPAFIRQQSN